MSDPTPDSSTESQPSTGRAGEASADLDEVLPVVYDELHRLAAYYLRRERAGHTLQPTALVNEAYLRLVDQRRIDWRNRAQVLGLAASMMRRILLNHARDRAAAKRGGAAGLEAERISLSLVGGGLEPRNLDLIDLDDALERLAVRDARKARVVELKFFGGLSIDEIAETLDLSTATVEREWSFARAWLFDALGGGASPA